MPETIVLVGGPLDGKQVDRTDMQELEFPVKDESGGLKRDRFGNTVLARYKCLGEKNKYHFMGELSNLA